MTDSGAGVSISTIYASYLDGSQAELFQRLIDQRQYLDLETALDAAVDAKVFGLELSKPARQILAVSIHKALETNEACQGAGALAAHVVTKYCSGGAGMVGSKAHPDLFDTPFLFGRALLFGPCHGIRNDLLSFAIPARRMRFVLPRKLRCSRPESRPGSAINKKSQR